MPVRVFVPRWMDRTNTNAQNANARALLSRFRGAQACWTALASDGPADSILQNKVQIRTITRSRFWNLHLALRYQERFDAVFYPGPHWGDYAGLELRSLRGKPAPVIATMEGIIIQQIAESSKSVKYTRHTINMRRKTVSD